MTVLREDNLFTEQTQVSENCFLALVDNALVRINFAHLSTDVKNEKTRTTQGSQ